MPSRALTAVALLAGAAVLAACATPAADTAEARQEPVYRTGSNIPVQNGGASKVTTATPDQTPMVRTGPTKPVGGGG